MTLVRRTNRNYDSIWNNLVNGDFYMNQNGLYCGNQSMPAINIIEDENMFSIELAAPGLNKEDFNIEFDNGKLTISAKKQEKEEETKNYTKREFNYAGFSRSFVVPKQKVDDGKISAAYENGVLNITLPKREEVKPKPSRTVEIA